MCSGDSPTRGILKNGKSAPKEKKKHLEGEIMNGERVPDMQLGKCRYVRLHDNVNYVAAGILLRGEGPETEVLLIQEAKKTCYGKWYMPAGRVEAGETLEVQGSGWYRFSFFCEIASGELKTKPNQESLGAQWWPVDEVLGKKLPLRVKDFLPLVEQGLAYREALHTDLPRILPLNINIPGLFIEFMIVRHSLDESRTEVLVHKSIKDEDMLIEHEQPFPTVEFGFEYFFAMVVSKVYRVPLDTGREQVDTRTIVHGKEPIPSNVKNDLVIKPPHTVHSHKCFPESTPL
ncbi:hydrolase, NUDIX family [Teladorsagia circumcincta]|uniref:Hydrolase, NUDIX family n=1 Tax=Teladorsagia circumcincta TaxID=45464 RepID=A0A2G9V091_TELCI|nr:hydrolase, NUDIX family [Teladorsagia circumcincta]